MKDARSTWQVPCLVGCVVGIVAIPLSFAVILPIMLKNMNVLIPYASGEPGIDAVFCSALCTIPTSIFVAIQTSNLVQRQLLTENQPKHKRKNN